MAVENERTVMGMDEYIEREAAIRMLRGSAIGKYPLSFSSGIFASADELKKLPAADVAPVRHGRWLFVTAGQMTSAWCCSECGRTVVITCDEELRQSKLEKEYPFCHCGAKMDLEV